MGKTLGAPTPTKAKPTKRSEPGSGKRKLGRGPRQTQGEVRAIGWFKVDDQLAFNAKVMLAGNSAMGLWVRAGSWSSAQLTGGFVPAHMANAMANGMANPCDSDALVMAGLWNEAEGGFQFHDWAEFQPDAEVEKAKRKATSDARSRAGKAGAQARWAGKPDGKPMANASAENGKPMPPTRPDPTHKEEAKASSSSSDAKASDPGEEFSDATILLCNYLADKIRANGNKVGKVGITWHKAMDRLMRLDGYAPEQIQQVIDWSQQDEFWQGNILSAAKLREKFDPLKTRMFNQRQTVGPQTATDRVRNIAEMAHRLQAQQDQAQLQIGN